MIDLPDTPSPQSGAPIYIDAGGTVKGGLGSPDQRVNRMGSRFGLMVTMPPLKSAKVGRQWVSRLIQAQSEGGRMAWPLNGFDPGLPGDVLVSGSGQAGSTLNVKGATPNYIFREGQFFSIVTASVHHVYMVGAETIASGTGTASLPIAPMLRVQHLDNDECHFGQPMIEGFISGDERQWQLAIGGFVGIEFEIRERK